VILNYVDCKAGIVDISDLQAAECAGIFFSEHWFCQGRSASWSYTAWGTTRVVCSHFIL